ncbi:MAG: hypothetical protein EBT08_14660 [Betaproteobacteria bacterium]|nr:hypothetical protein [Betaproteobacteria bacterium]
MPELPGELAARFEHSLGLSAYDARTLTADRATAIWFGQALSSLAALAGGTTTSVSPIGTTPGPASVDHTTPGSAIASDTPSIPHGPIEHRLAKLLANWMLGDLAAALNRDDRLIGASPVTPEQLAAIVLRIADGTVHQKMAKVLFADLWSNPQSSQGTAAALASVDHLIEARGFKQLSDTGALEATIDTVIAANTKSVDEFRAGKEKALNALVGQIMKATKGQANPAQVTEMLRRKLVA